MFITALFILARTWKQPRCPLADEWIRHFCYIQTMEYYSAIKKKSFESVLMRWFKLEAIIQTEVSQNEKHQYSIRSDNIKSAAQLCPTLCHKGGVTCISEVIDISPTILIPACVSSSPAFLIMYSAYKLNKQGDNIQP